MDGTLSSSKYRSYLVDNAPKDWSTYHGSMVRDRPIKEMIRLARRYKSQGYKVVILTLRPERFRPVTEKWLLDEGVEFDEAFFRPTTDFRRGREVKRDIYRTKIKPNYDVERAFDDFDEILSMWDEEGVPHTKVVDPDLSPRDIGIAEDPRYLPPSQGSKGDRTWVRPYIVIREDEHGNRRPVYVSGYWREFASVIEKLDRKAVRL